MYSKKSLRTLAIGLAAVAALTLSSCSGGSNPSGEGGGGGESTSKELTVWVMGDSSAHFDELVAPFEKSSGIEVNAVAIPWDAIDQKVTTAVASGDGPDLMQIGISKLRTVADSGALMTLDEATLGDRANLASSNFIDGVAGDATAVAGKVVSVPWVADTRVLFTRDDILAEAGVTAAPTSWDDIRATAKTLAARGGGNYGYYIPQWDSALPVIMTWDQGGDIVGKDGTIDFSSDAFTKAADLYTGFYADKSVPVNGDFDQTQGFTSGIAPMLVSGPYLAASIADAAPELDGKWSVHTLPGTSLLAGSNMGVWGKTDNKDGALDLLNYLSDPATQVKWFEIDGQLPTAKAALSDAKLTADKNVKVYSEQLADAKILPLVPNWDGETGKAMLDALNAISLTGADKASTLKTLVETTAGTPAQ